MKLRMGLPRYGGLLLGSSLAGALLVHGAVPGNALAARDLPVTVTMVSASSDLLSVRPAGNFIAKQPISRLPRRDATGSFTIHNPAGAAVALRVVVPNDGAPTAELVHISMRAGAEVVYAGTLAGLSREGSARFSIPDGKDLELSVRAWLHGSGGSDYEGRSVTVPLTLEGMRVT